MNFYQKERRDKIVFVSDAKKSSSDVSRTFFFLLSVGTGDLGGRG